ncbi:carbohydrate ABC transporter permease [Gracilibacillus kekensis]|uniref:Carbohydrate ABC transporter membrane protein 2, CUT1 family n=1 Tax=Gracilibacillus kekensis TaxID=1027249 RepID=A0A1M7Q8U2_9BACI|nr:carbohydrate ABC transporter permease [Gracilibacillus kekensis]SHN26933.1 carbohydrate ABC transporter membrane protein 2, CUT1 family [Gracilibacillus kekensis]
MTKLVKKIPLYLLAILILVITGLPFFIMFLTSFKGQMEFMTSPWSWPENFSLDSYKLLIELEFFGYFWNSMIVSVISVVIVIFIAAMASYPLARLTFRLNRPIFIIFMVGMMIPIHTTLVPIFTLTNDLGLYDSLLGLVGPYIAFALPISVVIFTQFMRDIPKELEESAKIDGCSHIRLFWNIIFPLLTPAVATVSIYNFIQIWNEFIFALTLTSSSQTATLPIGLREFYGEFSVNIPGIMAALTLGSLPLLLVYFVAQEKIVAGLAAGSVKG